MCLSNTHGAIARNMGASVRSSPIHNKIGVEEHGGWMVIWTMENCIIVWVEENFIAWQLGQQISHRILSFHRVSYIHDWQFLVSFVHSCPASGVIDRVKSKGVLGTPMSPAHAARCGLRELL